LTAKKATSLLHIVETPLDNESLTAEESPPCGPKPHVTTLPYFVKAANALRVLKILDIPTNREATLLESPPEVASPQVTTRLFFPKIAAKAIPFP
jgi:hypothetical protein